MKEIGKAYSRSLELRVIVEEVVTVDEHTGYYGDVPGGKPRYRESERDECSPVEDPVER